MQYRYSDNIKMSFIKEVDNYGKLYFFIDNKKILEIRAVSDLNDILLNMPYEFSEDTFIKAISHDKSSDLFNLLLRNKIIKVVPNEVAIINFFLPYNKLIKTVELRSPKPIKIDFLVGDYFIIQSQQEYFYKLLEETSNSLVGNIIITDDAFFIGPIRFLFEVNYYVSPRLTNERYPLANLVSKFNTIVPIISHLIQEALLTGLWYRIATTGVKHSLKIEIPKGPLNIEVNNITTLSNSINLHYWSARVEDSPRCSGVSWDSQSARTAALCEAKERFAISHPEYFTCRYEDKNLPIIEVRGRYFDYLRVKSNSSNGYIVGQDLKYQSKYRIPKDWIFFYDNPSLSNTNGTAFGPSILDAIESAKQELIERHVFTKLWYGEGNSTLLKIQPSNQIKYDLYKIMASEKNLDVSFYLLDSYNSYCLVLKKPYRFLT